MKHLEASYFLDRKFVTEIRRFARSQIVPIKDRMPARKPKLLVVSRVAFHPSIGELSFNRLKKLGCIVIGFIVLSL